ncbi:MAG: EscU/YscU/HrcU family type III secretion system export apparatus switch protein [Ignavibacteria bacterium]|nr:EscU/YscU/HrcU family type III secretion system export apparatus switch protein [Ignavibacteria bacterium]
MAETPEGREKTEPATPRRLSEARQRGQVAKSIDVTTAVMIFIGGFITLLFINVLVKNLQGYFQQSISSSFFTNITDKEVIKIFLNSLFFLAQTILPLLGLIYFIVLVSEISQVGFHLATKKFTKGLNFRTLFNLLGGIKRIFFSGRAYFELVKSLIKLIILGWVVYSVLKKYIIWDLSLVEKPIWEIPQIMFTVTFELIAKVGAIYVLIAAADFLYQKYRYKEDLKMTKEEVKEEGRQSEGDPMVKSRIRGLMRQRVRKIILKNLQKRADVVVANPTHFAVALEYKPYKMNAPVVVAKGVDFLALKIREIAEENGIPVVEEPPLAQALYYSVDIDEEIPEFLFKAVAQVLAFVYYLKETKTSNA